ncbi:MAG TPA: GNAT family N-acetyltransferase [Gemmatimonadaceae bacterium]
MSADVSTIYLVDGVTGDAVEAELRHEIGVQQVADWQAQWQPALLEVLRDLVARQVPMNLWPQSWHWRWDRKVAEMAGLLAFQGFSVVCGGVAQGLMGVDLTKSARIPEQIGKPVVYVEYLEVAPWNRTDCVAVRRYKGVGTALLTAASALSEQEGFRGRISLHSLPQADAFYQNLGMTDLGPDQHYGGQLRYFEFTATQAAKFLGE